MTTSKEDSDFISEVISQTLLEESMQWIGDNLNPEEVFSERKLAEWATENGFVEGEE